ncbi:hypothetical protein ACWDOP_14025 [Nocardia sp. NPDC003693]
MAPQDQPDVNEVVRAAIELLTMWISEIDGSRDQQAEYIGRRIADLDETGRIHLIRGQLYLNELLLMSVTETDGDDDAASLHAQSLLLLRELALEVAE